MRLKLLFLPIPLFSVSFLSADTYPAANGLERKLVAEQPLLKNPVSVSMDVDGTIYVTETARRKVADLDIREFVKFGWVPHDVGLTSVEEKRAFFQEQLNGKKKFGGTSLKDQNKDGKIDVKDLTAISEKIIRITDKNGDGVYDTSNVFADGFNTEVTGIAAGTLAWRGDVYATIAPDVWKLRDSDGDGKADKRESLAHGFGLHIAYAGHDMHGLILGPDGRLYWTIGDKGTHVIDKDGKKHYAPHEGAVLRCYPDGSGFEIFARGLRNPQEIAFDKYGNLFSVDNDADFKGERERFLYITEGSDTGWRCYYQYRGASYNPWMAESIWQPSGAYQPAYITPTTGNFSDGPSGFAYNPGTALNEKYADAFFVTEFPKGNLLSFKVKPKGAGFEIADSHTVLSGPMNVGINFGPDGALYSADWAGGYPLNEKGAVWKIDDPKVAATEIRKEVAGMLKAGVKEISTKDLVKRLSHADMRVRIDAQWELVERKAVKELMETASSEASEQMAVIHSLWGLGQLKKFDKDLFEKLSKSKDSELRIQALRYAAESGVLLVNGLSELMKDGNPHVRFHAAMFVWKSHMLSKTCFSTEIYDAVLGMLAENNNEDTYLRHAGVMALTRFDESFLRRTMLHKSPAVRLAAAVALRRLSSPLVKELLADSDAKVVAEAAHSIFDDPPIRSAYPALAELIRTNPKASIPAVRRSIAANRYLADKQSVERLAEFATRGEVETSLRVAALEALASWAVASELNPVDGRYDPLKPADIEIAKAAFAPVAKALQHDKSNEISAAVGLVTKSLGILADGKEMQKQALDAKEEVGARLRAMEALGMADRALYLQTLPQLIKDKNHKVRSRAATLLAEHDATSVIAYAEAALYGGDEIQEKQEAVRLLAKLKPAALEKMLEKPEAALLIELSEAFPKKDIKLDPSIVALLGGNAEQGKVVFNEHLAAQCIACHRIGDEGSEVGPPLTEVGKKGRGYILESLLDPQKAVTPGYGVMSAKMKDGTTLTGVFKAEDETSLTLILPDKKEIVLAIQDIESRTTPVSSMPPMGGILTPRQLRDLVEYLSSQN